MTPEERAELDLRMRIVQAVTQNAPPEDWERLFPMVLNFVDQVRKVEE